MIAVRAAQTEWLGPLASGHGTLPCNSGYLMARRSTWSATTEQSDGKSTPEELRAAGRSAGFAMALPLTFANDGTRPERLEARAMVGVAEVDGAQTIVSSAIAVAADIPAIDGHTVEVIVEHAPALGVVSSLFASAEITVAAHLVCEQR